MKPRWLVKVVLAVLVGALGCWLRLDAASKLPVDADEDTYINAALHYASSIRRGEWKQIYKFDYNSQHPILGKLSYAAALLPVSPAEKLQPKDIPFDVPVQQTEGKLWILTARRNATMWGGLAVGAIAWVNPLAGLLLAFHAAAIKFTSEIYLETLPMFTSLLAMMAYEQWRKREFEAERPVGSRYGLWLAASSILLGMTAAGKYIYCMAGLAIVADFACCLMKDRRRMSRRVLNMALWIMGAWVSFFLFDPFLWIHTVPRFVDSVIFHFNYTHSDNVTGSGRPWWYTFYLLFHPSFVDAPSQRQVFYCTPDIWIAALGLLGLPFLWRKHPPYAIWLVFCLLFLLLWPTKWDQYILIAVPALCLSAGILVEEGFIWLRRFFVDDCKYLW